MDTIYFDWGGGYLTALRNDDGPDQIFRPASCDELLDSLTVPTRLISEATFESFDIDTRAAVINRAHTAGHEWLTTPNRQTGRTRRAMGWADEKTDDIDVQVIRYIAQTNPAALKVPNVRLEDDPLVLARDEANHELMLLRRTRRIVPNRSRLGFKVVSAKDDYSDKLIALLPDYSTLDHKIQAALGNGKEYSRVLIAAAAKATKFSANRRDFDHFTGLFAHGYPSQIRSDVHHWRWRFAREGGKSREAGKITLSDFRRGCRWLYHRLDEIREVL